MSRLVLYKKNASPPSCAVMMLGDILGLRFEFVEPELLKMEHKAPKFKKLNPMGTIPVLQDGDFVIAESHCIMTYLVSKYGGDHKELLYPSDVTSRALVDQALYFDSAVMFNHLKHVARPTFLFKLPGPTEQDIKDMEESYGALEAYLENNKFVAADHMTLADLSLGSTVVMMQVMHQLDGSRYPRAAAWKSRLEAEPYFESITAPGAQEFAALMKLFWQRNKENKTKDA